MIWGAQSKINNSRNLQEFIQLYSVSAFIFYFTRKEICSKLWCKNYTKIQVKQTCSLRVSLLLWGRKKVSWVKLGNFFLGGHKTPICDLQFWGSQSPEKANVKDSIHFSDDDLCKKIEIFIVKKCWIFVDDYHQIILLPDETS